MKPRSWPKRRAHGNPARRGSPKTATSAKVALRRRPRSACPARTRRARPRRSNADDRSAEGRALRRFGVAFARRRPSTFPTTWAASSRSRTSDGTQLLFLRPSDVPAYVEFGAADCGIVGKDVLWETDRTVSELADLGFGYCRLCVAAPGASIAITRARRFPTVSARRDEVRALGRGDISPNAICRSSSFRCTVRSN